MDLPENRQLENTDPSETRSEKTTKGPPLFDLHCHILPCIDDGAQSLDEALNMARMYVDDGVDCVVATPHCHRYTHLLRRDILPAVIQFNDSLRNANIPLTVLPGSEIQVIDSAEYQREFELGVFCHLGDSRKFTLLEFNWQPELFPENADELIRWICGQGLTPIVAHPERHHFFWEDLSRLDPLVESGAWLQVTVDSLIGNHGPAPSQAGRDLLRQHTEIVLASDAHNIKRCSGMSAGYEWVREHEGNQRADDLLRRVELVRTELEQVTSVSEPQTLP